MRLDCGEWQGGVVIEESEDEMKGGKDLQQGRGGQWGFIMTTVGNLIGKLEDTTRQLEKLFNTGKTLCYILNMDSSGCLWEINVLTSS